MLHPGLYEQVISNALSDELSAIPEVNKEAVPIDKAEVSKFLTQYLADVVQQGLDNLLNHGGALSSQVGLANQIITLIPNTTQEADFAVLSVDQRRSSFLRFFGTLIHGWRMGKQPSDLSRTEASIAQSSLFTGAIHEPQMYTELKKEIVSADCFAHIENRGKE